MKGTDIFNGTNGTLWLSTDDMEIPVGSFQTFTLHQNNEFEDVNEAEFLGKKKRLLGYELTGTISKYKTDHAMAAIMEKYKDGETPDINFVAKAYNPNTKSIGVIKVIGVTFNECDIMNLELKTATKEEIPYSAESYKWITKV